MYVWKNGIQPLMILYLDVTAAGEQIRMSKLSVPRIIYKPNSYSKDIRLLPLKAGDWITTRTTVHSPDTVSVVVGCSLVPIAVDISGIIRLSNALTRVEERLSRVIETCYCNKVSHRENKRP
jgi:hypothetical protein